MDLKRRLARLDRGVGRGPGSADASVDRDAATAALGLARVDGDAGPVWMREAAADVPPPRWSPTVLDGALTRPVPEGLDWGDVLFLDTETTGLAGGTGTLAFLVGAAWWEGGGLRIRQTFLPSPVHEASLLADLAAMAGRFRLTATFNGHAYDLPLLRTRGILNRRRDLLDGLGSWDLLPLARRLWGRRLSDCRQGTVEREVLQFGRDGEDIPGARIPAVWTEFVKEGRDDGLAAVLEHNRWDVEGMATMLHAAVGRCALLAGGRSGVDRDAAPWQDRWSLARLAESRRDRDGEARWMRAAVAAAPLDETRLELRLGPPEGFLADALRIVKRTGDWPLTASLLGAARRLFPDRPWVYRETAILYEHRLVDLPRALAAARGADEPERVARLERKLARQRGSS